jgi:hypothetical protein
MKPLEKTVTHRVAVDSRIADLVYFARTLAGKDIKNMTDEDLINLAESFWDTQHGED